jgi:hypothetical protein
MRDLRAAPAALVITLCLASQAKADDPCLPAPTTGNALTGLATLLGQQQRDQACTTLRQSQWADYFAHQKSQQPPGTSVPRPQAAQDTPQYGNNALQMMTRAVVTFGALRALYAAAPRAR